MLPATRDLTIYKGDTFTMQVRLRQKTVDGLAGASVDLTGATPKAQVRTDYDAPAVLADFTCTLAPATSGIIQLELSAAQTATFTTGVWDLQVTFPDGRIRTYVTGTVTTQKEVTHV